MVAESQDHDEIASIFTRRHARVKKLIDVAERVCSKLEHPTASVTIFDQTDLRAALDALKVGG